MKSNRVIELTENDINTAVRMYVKDKLSSTEVSGAIRYYTSVRGDYDKGNAKEYIKSVIIEINEL
jgi:hypothetical protein